MRFVVRALPLLLLLAATLAPAQDRHAGLRVQSLREITRDVWEPFIRGVNGFDDPAYLAVRSEDFVLVQSIGKSFLDHEAYVDDTVRVMADLKKAGVRLQVAIRFDERFADARFASERGIMRMIRTDADGTRQVSHTRFHAIARKEGGRWRVVSEYRWRTTPEDDALAFAAARDIDAVEAFR